MSPLVVALSCGAALLALGLLTVPLAGAKRATVWVYGATAGVCAVLLAAAAVGLLASRPADALVLPMGLPWLGAHFGLDPLSAWFLLIVAVGGLLAAVFGIGYGAHGGEPGRVLPFVPAFVAGMSFVVLARDAFTFLLAWEFMSLASWALVVSHHRGPDTVRAGFVYLVMASFGTVALLLCFGILAGTSGGYAFEAIRGTARDPLTVGAVLALMVLGAGSKAGLVPLHVWLPLAHPAAPSHVSALMSAVMTKVAIYGLVRVFFDLMGPPLWWEGAIVLALGAGTAVVGILHAALERDSKRLLAYSTIENVGVIVAALGLALAFAANDMAAPAAIVLAAALFHALNHSLFKTVLFFGAGAVLAATGTRDLARMGGLIHRMPVTAATFLIGGAAISALPPLNGFASEWLIFQSILQSPAVPQWALKFLVPAAGGLLALAAALAAATFVKVIGTMFLGRPRSPDAEAAHEAGAAERWAMIVPAALCIIVGMVPGQVLDALAPVTEALLGGARVPVQWSMPWLSLVPVAESESSYNGLLVALFMLTMGGGAAWLLHRVAPRALRRGAAWGCGFEPAGATAQYGPTSFAQPLARVFAPMFAVREDVEMPPPGDIGPARHRLAVRDYVWDFAYLPVARGISRAADRLNALQYLTIRRYLSIVFGALVLLLLVLAA